MKITEFIEQIQRIAEEIKGNQTDIFIMNKKDGKIHKPQIRICSDFRNTDYVQLEPKHIIITWNIEKE